MASRAKGVTYSGQVKFTNFDQIFTLSAMPSLPLRTQQQTAGLISWGP